MRRFFTDAAFTATSQLVSALAAFAIQIYVARTVSLVDYGQYASIQAFVLLVEAIFIARGGEVALQYIGQNWKLNMPRALWFRNRLCKMDAKFNVLIYFAVIAVGFGISSILNFNWSWLALLALTIPAQVGYGVFKSTFIVAGRFQQLAYLEIVYSILLVVLTWVLVTWKGVLGFIFAMVFGAMIKTLLARAYSQTFWPVGLKAVPPDNAMGHGGEFFLNANIHSIVRNSLMNGASQGDLLILNAMQGPEAAALYKVAKTTAAIPVRVVTPVWVVLRARIMSAMRGQDFSRIQYMLILAGVILVVIGAVGAVPLSLYAQPLITLAFGDAYGAASSAAIWLLLGTWIFGAVSGWLNFACVITSKKYFGSLIYSVWAAVVLLGGIYWGGEAATNMAIVAAVGMGLASLIGWVYFMRKDAWIDDTQKK